MQVFKAFLIIVLAMGPLVPKTGWSSVSRPRVAVVTIFNEKFHSSHEKFRRQFAKEFLNSKKVELVPELRLLSFFHSKQQNVRTLTPGDQKLGQAEDLYYSFKNQLAIEKLDEAITDFKRHPGLYGGIFEALVFKGQILWELGHKSQANKNFLRAASYNIGKSSLDENIYPPAIQKAYKRAYKKHIKKETLVPLHIRARSSGDVPIFVNGSLRGMGPKVIIDVPSGQEQLVTAGNNPFGVVTKVTGGEKIKIKPSTDKRSSELADIPVGFQTANADLIMIQARELGVYAEADYVVMLSLKDLDKGERLEVTVLDVSKFGAAKSRVIDAVGRLNDSKSLVSHGVDYALSSFHGPFTAHKNYKEAPVSIKKSPKSFFKSPVGIILTGAVIAGASTALAVGLSGGGQQSSVETSVSGPLPTVPGEN